MEGLHPLEAPPSVIESGCGIPAAGAEASKTLVVWASYRAMFQAVVFRFRQVFLNADAEWIGST